MLIDASELTNFGRDCVVAAGAVQVESVAVVRASTSEVLQLAVGNAPELTGELKRSGRAVVNGTTGEVVFDSDHASFVEEGTSLMAPEPYLGPAFDAIEPRFEHRAGDGIVKAIL